MRGVVICGHLCFTRAVGSTTFRTGIAGALACAIVAAVGARQVFKSSVEYVRLDVVVTDKNDRPVTGLTQADFIVTERGRAQDVATFEAVSIPTSRVVTTTTTFSTPTMDVVSNQPAPLARQWVMVIDDLHIIEHQTIKTKKAVAGILGEIPETDPVAIVFVGRSDLSQGFTTDRGAQLRTVDRIKDALGFAYDANNDNGLPSGRPPGNGSGSKGAVTVRTIAPSDPGESMEKVIDSNESGRHQYALATVDVLTNIAKSLADSPYPRKAMIYVSEGATYSLDTAFAAHEFDFKREAEYTRDFIDQMAKTFETAKRAGVPVYTFDPRGLPDGSATRSGVAAPGVFVNQWNNMRTIAENTGGLAFVGMSDVTRAIQTMVHDSDSYYLIGFYPEPLVRDGKFHDVDVKIKGRPELRVRARAGYSAPAAVPPPPVDLNAAFITAMGAALPTYGISLRAQAAPLTRGNKGVKTAVTLQVTYPVTADRAKIDDTLEYSAVALDGDGKIKASARHSFHFTASPKKQGDATFVINDVIELPTQPLTLRVGVASKDLGKIGVIHLPVEPAKTGSSDTEMGAVVIGYAGAAREDAKPKDMFSGLVPFQPTTDREFRTTDVIRIFAPVSWQGAAPATVAFSITQGAKTIVRRTDQLMPVSAEAATTTRLMGRSSERSSASFTAPLPMTGVPAGDYVLSILVSAQGKPARRDVAFRVR